MFCEVAFHIGSRRLPRRVCRFPGTPNIGVFIDIDTTDISIENFRFPVLFTVHSRSTVVNSKYDHIHSVAGAGLSRRNPHGAGTAAVGLVSVV